MQGGASRIQNLEIQPPPPPLLDHGPEKKEPAHRNEPQACSAAEHTTTVTSDLPPKKEAPRGLHESSKQQTSLGNETDQEEGVIYKQQQRDGGGPADRNININHGNEGEGAATGCYCSSTTPVGHGLQQPKQQEAGGINQDYDKETEKTEISGRERLKRHRIEVAGRVWIPERWGQEELLKDWIDCSAFDSSLIPNGIMSARAALIQGGRRASTSSRRF